MKIVLDTNVLVAGLLSPYRSPAQVLQLVAGKVQICIDLRIVSEYRQVLARPKFGFDPDPVEDLVDYLEQAGEWVIPTPWGLALPEADDAVFLEVAKAGGACYSEWEPRLHAAGAMRWAGLDGRVMAYTTTLVAARK